MSLSLQTKAVDCAVEGAKDHASTCDGDAGLVEEGSDLISAGIQFFAGHGIERVQLGGDGTLDSFFEALEAVIGLRSEFTGREHVDDAIRNHRGLGTHHVS